MEDLEYLKEAVTLMHKRSPLPQGQQGANGQQIASDSGEADDQRLKWRRMNIDAHIAYAALFAHARRDFVLPDMSGKLLEIPEKESQRSQGTFTFPNVTAFLQHYLSPVTHHDERSRVLVGDYIARMQDLIAQSRVIVSGSPAEGNRPNSAPSATSDPETHSQTALSMIVGAKEHLAALGDYISRNTHTFVPRKAYDALRDDWNVLQKRHYDRDNHTIVSLIEAITDLRRLYGVSQAQASTPVGDSQEIFVRAVNSLTLRLETLLESNYAIMRIPITAGTPFDSQIMTVDTSYVEMTSESRLVGTVAQVVDNGYWRKHANEANVVYQRARVIRYGAPDRQRK